MSIRYESLDDEVRECMLEELRRDVRAGTVYISPRLTGEGAAEWPELLREALESRDDQWLAMTVRERGLLREKEQRRKPKGGFTLAAIPVTAPETLAEGEFNRYYARGVCTRALACGETKVEVCRGKEAAVPRAESEAMIGTHMEAQALLDDLRASQGLEPALHLPPGPNSGLTVRRI